MAIPDEEVAQVRSATDLVALVGEHTALRQQGRRWVGLCPFHSEKTPSFGVNATDGLYYCFGCQASGDAITFVRATEHLDFAEAVRFLAERAGVTLHETDEGSGERRRRGEILDAMARAVGWYHQRLLSAKDAGPARDYLRSRGYDGQIVRQFSLGWAPDDWDVLCRWLRAAGMAERVIVDSGLGFVNRAGRLQDAFRGRVLFPIFDPSGRAVALGGRVLPPRPGDVSAGARTEPKYKNSPETAVYSKRRTLYGLNWAKHDIVASGEVVVCEGYTDVIGCFVAGVPRAVATCGTALAEEHFGLLHNFGKRIVLAYDADQAGQAATARIYEWERRHEVDLRVATLPAGSDPAELSRRDPDALRSAVSEAVPYLQFRIDRILGGGELSTAEGRARSAEGAISALAEHPDGLVRDQYLMRVAGVTRLDLSLLRDRLEAQVVGRRSGERRNRTGAPQATRPGKAEGHARRERGGPDAAGESGARSERSQGARRVTRPGLEALRLALHRPELVADRLEEPLFGDDLQRQAFVALVDADDLHQAVASAAPDVADLLRRLSVEEPAEPDDPQVDPADSVVAQLIRQAVRRALDGRQMAARAGQADFGKLAAETAAIRLRLQELDDPSRCRDAAGLLVAWLSGGEQHGSPQASPATGLARTTEPT